MQRSRSPTHAQRASYIRRCNLTAARLPQSGPSCQHRRWQEPVFVNKNSARDDARARTHTHEKILHKTRMQSHRHTHTHTHLTERTTARRAEDMFVAACCASARAQRVRERQREQFPGAPIPGPAAFSPSPERFPQCSRHTCARAKVSDSARPRHSCARWRRTPVRPHQMP
jgi:hypothetical protein